MGKAIFGSSGVTKGYAFSPQFGHFPGFAFSACGSFAADYGTTEVRPHKPGVKELPVVASLVMRAVPPDRSDTIRM